MASMLSRPLCFKMMACSDKIMHALAPIPVMPWASYQIRKIAGCACARNAGNVFPRRRFQRKPLVSDPGMHHGTCVTHVPWCKSGSLTCGDGENVPGITGACATQICVSGKRPIACVNLFIFNWYDLTHRDRDELDAICKRYIQMRCREWNILIFDWIPLKFVPKCPIDNKTALI